MTLCNLNLKDGRLKSSDSILQINDVNLGGKGSDEVASILRKAGSKVKLVISRIVDEEPPEIPVRPDTVRVYIHEPFMPINNLLKMKIT